PTPDLYTLSLHDALPISDDPGFCRLRTDHQRGRARDGAVVGILGRARAVRAVPGAALALGGGDRDLAHRAVGWGARITILDRAEDRKSTRLNSSHVAISY